MKNNKRFRSNQGTGSLAFAALLLFSTQASPAASNDRVSFRDFRQENAGIDRSAARHMFRQQFGRPAHSGLCAAASLSPVIGVGANGAGPRIDGLMKGHQSRVRNQSMQQVSTGVLTRVNNGVELDLGSSTRNIVLGKGLFAPGGTVEVSVGGKIATFQAGSQVTAAEYVAVKQVLSGVGQQVQVDRAGRATGGCADLGSLTDENAVMRAASLIVPQNVTIYGDFARGSDFRLAGDLSNYGTVQALSSVSSVRGGGIHADDINNHSGALINSTVDLKLDASSSLINDGVITSSGSLSLSAGGSFSNSGKVESKSDLLINSGNVINRGTLSSSAGNVSFGADPSTTLSVDNRRGTISAYNAVNVRDFAYAGKADSYLVGGDVLSRDLNLNSGLGAANVAVNKLTGTINETGTAAHVLASTETMNLGTVCLTGDPTFYNTNGSINITNDVTVDQDLVIIASLSITSADNVKIKAGDATSGHNITFISGASFTASGGSQQSNLGPINGPPYPTSGSVTFGGKGSSSGGGIDLGANVEVNSRSTDTNNDRDGGNIEFWAFGKVSGSINLDGTKILSGGQKLGKNGDVFMGAEYNGLLAISTATIDTTNQLVGSEGTGGSLFISTAKPVIVNGKSVTYDATGARTSPGFISLGTKPSKEADIVLSLDGSPVDVASEVNVNAGQRVFVYGPVSANVATLKAGFGMINDPGGAGSLTARSSMQLETGKKGLIGDPSQFFSIDTPLLTILGAGSKAAVQFTGATGTAVINASGGDILFVDAANLTLQGSVDVGSQLLLVADTLSLNNATAGSLITLVSTNSAILNPNNTYIAPTLQLNGIDIGTALNPFNAASGVKEINISASGKAFVTSLATKSVVLGDVSATDLDFKANTGIELTKDISTTGGALAVSTTAGTVEIDPSLLIFATNSINLTNSGVTKKDKIVIGANAVLRTTVNDGILGDINIILGTGGGAPVATPANVGTNESGGATAQFLGFGLTAKAPNNNVTAQGADVTFSNSIATKNISLGGNVTVFADPPVPAGSVVLRTDGGERSSSNRRISREAASRNDFAPALLWVE